jgi:hypothetical protein
MLLTTAAFLSILGFTAWVLGHVYSYQGIATLGAVLMVGVGAAVMVGGLETPAGEERVETTDVNTTELTNADGNVTNVTASETTTAEVTTVYEPIGTTSSFPTGLVLTLLGGVMTLRAVEGGQI